MDEKEREKYIKKLWQETEIKNLKERLSEIDEERKGKEEKKLETKKRKNERDWNRHNESKGKKGKKKGDKVRTRTKRKETQPFWKRDKER